MKKQDDGTTIRVSRETWNYITDVKRMLELTLGRDLTLDEVVHSSAQIAYGEKLDQLKVILGRVAKDG
jgi:hypothetical protein